MSSDIIPQKELRNDVGRVLRRVEAGDVVTVTVAGRPVAELHPVRRRTWVSGPALEAVFRSEPPQSLIDDLVRLEADLTDPFIA